MRNWRHLVTICSAAAVSSLACAQSGYLTVTPYPALSVADGRSTLTVTAYISTNNGTAVPDGTQVIFQTDLGTFRESILTTKDGYARAIMVAGSLPGTAQIKVKVLGFPIAPQTAEVEFLSDRALLSSAREYIELVSPTVLKYSPQDRLILAEGAGQGVKLRYRDIEISADELQLGVSSYEVRARKATVKVGKVTREYAEFHFFLNRRKGSGITTFTRTEIESVSVRSKFPSFKAINAERIGYVDVVGDRVSPSPNHYVGSEFQFADFTAAPALIAAKKAVVFPSKEVQFQRAELYVGDSKVMKLPLYRAPLNTSSPTFTDQIINVNDNQLAIAYPYYLTLKPGETSQLRFHMGDHTNQFGGGTGPQLDYQLDWNRGDEMDGGFTIGGLGQESWGVGLHQFYRLDDRTTGYAQIQMPAARSLFGTVSMSHEFSDYSLNLSSNITRTLRGVSQNDETTSLSFERNPVRLGKSPFDLHYGIIASHVSTTAPIPIQVQESVGIRASLQMQPQTLDRHTTISASLALSQLQGMNVQSGIGIGGMLTLTRQLSHASSLYMTYDYSQDPLQSLQLGAHRVSGQFYFAKGNTTLSLSGSTSLDVDRLDYSGLMSYRVAPAWRLGSTYTYYKYLGSGYLDYSLAVYYRLGIRDIGLTWSYQTGRLGIQILGASFN